GIKGTSASVENAHHFPRSPTKFHGIAQFQAGIRGRDVAANDEFTEAGGDEMALDDADIVANFQHGFGNATNLDVGVGPRGFEREIGDDNNLWGDQRLLSSPISLSN